MNQSIAFGVDFDFTTGKAQRLGASIGKAPGADFDAARMYGGRKRCNLTDDGTVVAYYGEEGYSETGALNTTLVKNGKTYAAGTPVQVMVEQPKFYYKVEPVDLEPIEGGQGHHIRRARWWVSEYAQPGFRVYPSFLRRGVEYDFIYASAYEASIYDKKKAAYYYEDENVFTATPSSTLTLSSIAGTKPASGANGQMLNRANARVLAANRGEGWQLIDCLSLNATELLMLVEYASFDSKKVIGKGVVNKEVGEGGSGAEKTGRTAHLGNTSGSGGPDDGFSSVTYRGEENLWGNIWKLVDGLNFECSGINAVWWSDGEYQDDYKGAPYRNTGFTLCKENGFTSAFAYSEECDFMFLTSEVKGTEEGPVGDYFKQNNTFEGWQSSMFGGRWCQKTWPGLFFWYADLATGRASSNISARIMYLPIQQ